MSGDDRSWVERDKLSFSELDRRRRERRSSGATPPRSEAARERSEAATKQYLKEIDGVFSGGGKAEVARLVTAMRDALGTPGLADACRAYRDAIGPPHEASLISLFLDSGESELILQGLDAIRAGHESGGLKLTSGLRSQLRMLSQGSDDEVAEMAEELLEAL